MNIQPLKGRKWSRIYHCLRLIFTGLLHIAALSAACARPDSPRFTRISVNDGLSQSYVYTIFQDSKGFIWLGTRDGLNKYDGHSFIHYKPQSSRSSAGSLSSSVIRSICEDRYGALWIGTFRGGLNRFDRRTGTFTSYRHDPKNPRSLLSDDANVVYTDQSGTLWIGTRDHGLSRMIRGPSANGKGDVVLEHYVNIPGNPASLRSNGILDLHQDRLGYLWIATPNGLDRLDPRTGTFMHVGPDETINGISVDSEGIIWVGYFSSGLARIDPRTIDITLDRRFHYIKTIVEYEPGTLFVGGSTGLYLYSLAERTIQRFQHQSDNPSSLSHTSVLALLKDRSNVLWIGTEDGISKLNGFPARFTLFTDYPGESSKLSSRNVRSVFEDSDSIVWIGTAGKGLTRLDRSTGTTTHHLFDQGNFNFINIIRERSPQTLWIGTRSGIKVFDRRTMQITAQDDPVVRMASNCNVWSLHRDQAGMVWVGGSGTDRPGLLRFDPTDRSPSGRLPDAMAGFDATTVWKIHEDRQGELWMGTPEGLYRVNRERTKVTQYQHDPRDSFSLRHNEVWTLLEDRTGAIWAGTWGGGLGRLDRATGRFTNYSEKEGLPSNVIHSLVEDRAGCLWISSGGGISKLDPRTQTIVNFDARDGLQSNEFNPNASWQMRSGEIYFGGLSGLTSFFPDRTVSRSTYAPPIVVTSFRKFDTVVASELFDGASVEILPNQNFCSFEFAMLDYQNPGKILYAYKLEGFDHDWIYCGTRRYAAYTNLDPGTFTFRVRATNSEGVWQDQGLAITVHVIPPFWRTNEFMALASGMGIVSVVVVDRARRRSRRRRDIALDEAREIERREIAAELHDGPLQDLYATRFVLEPFSTLVDSEDRGAAVSTLEETLKRARSSLRNICGHLQLPTFESGLDVAIETYAARFREIHRELDVRLELMHDGGLLTENVRQNLFRIYRTALNNIAKHARASRIIVRLVIHKRQLLLEVQDNGCGFKPPHSLSGLMKEEHYGLLLADAHARAIGGRLTVISAPGEGTMLRVTLEP